MVVHLNAHTDAHRVWTRIWLSLSSHSRSSRFFFLSIYSSTAAKKPQLHIYLSFSSIYIGFGSSSLASLPTFLLMPFFWFLFPSSCSRMVLLQHTHITTTTTTAAATHPHTHIYMTWDSRTRPLYSVDRTERPQHDVLDQQSNDYDYDEQRRARYDNERRCRTSP